MNKDEAKFLLRAMRPNTSDVQDPVFAEPMKEAQNDPELCAWLQSEQALDDMIARKLKDVPPPAGLEEAILAGVRATQQPRRARWTMTPWLPLAIAASIAIVATVGVRVVRSHRVGAEQLAEIAMNDLATAHPQHEAHPANLASVWTAMENSKLPLPAHLKVDLDQLARAHCRSFSVGDTHVYEICFKRQGVWFHLYAGRVDQFKGQIPGVEGGRSSVFSRGTLSAAVWQDAGVAYALVTRSDLLPPVLSTIFLKF